jgi:plastocyanin
LYVTFLNPQNEPSPFFQKQSKSKEAPPCLSVVERLMQQQQKKQKPKTIHVTIKGNKFEPQTLKIVKNTVVHWTVNDDDENKGDQIHCMNSYVIGFDNLDDVESGILKRKATFKVRFLASGTFNYRCILNTRMKGTIEVVAEETAPSAVKSVKFNKINKLFTQKKTAVV